MALHTFIYPLLFSCKTDKIWSLMTSQNFISSVLFSSITDSTKRPIVLRTGPKD
uniref:Uncharacterized protein n=1 Tax=Lepeophtheirus salmonis TaxID=72036 RepID=A0A0K2U130_LEPSM